MPNWNYPLRTNDAGANVNALHAFLKKLDGGFTPDQRPVVPPTGPPSMRPFFGANTIAAVKAFQTAHGIPDSGEVDWVTGHLMAWAVESVDSKYTRPLTLMSFGNEIIGDDVAELRKELIEWRKANGIGENGKIEKDKQGSGNPSTKVYGSNMAAAVRQFKQTVGLTDDSVANHITFKTLWRLRRPLSGDPFTLAGTISTGAGVNVDLYAETSSDRFLLANGVSTGGGAFSLPFKIHKTSTDTSVELPLTVYARIGDRLLGSASVSVPFRGVNLTGQTITAPNHILVGLVVKPNDQEEVPAGGVAVRALASELDQAPTPMTLDERKQVATATTGTDGVFELAFNAPSSDVRVEAFDGGSVLAVSPLFFNLRPIEFAAKLVLPPDGIKPPPILQPTPGVSEFERLKNELTNAGYVPDQMWPKLQGLGPARREAILRYVAGDVAIARGALKRPRADSESYDTDTLKYQQEVEKFIRLTIVPISKIIQAYELASLADTRIQAIPGFTVELPLASDRKLTLNLDKTTSTAQGLTEAFYALLPNAKMDIPADKALRLITRTPSGEARATLNAARLDNVIDVTVAEIDSAIVWMAEFRLQLRQQPQWGCGRRYACGCRRRAGRPE